MQRQKYGWFYYQAQYSSFFCAILSNITVNSSHSFWYFSLFWQAWKLYFESACDKNLFAHMKCALQRSNDAQKLLNNPKGNRVSKPILWTTQMSDTNTGSCYDAVTKTNAKFTNCRKNINSKLIYEMVEITKM